MPLPYRIATLIYAFNQEDKVLLLSRRNQPNQGLWSPCGGKLKTSTGESPHMCAAREAQEEMGVSNQPLDFHLTGIISEHGYNGEANWLMFLFEYLPRLKEIPPSIEEGSFDFFAKDEISALNIPHTDREQIWPLFWKHRGGFFVAHCQCSTEGDRWTLEQTKPRDANGL
jgi:8-oxo-dGTP diphosphatase